MESKTCNIFLIGPWNADQIRFPKVTDYPVVSESVNLWYFPVSFVPKVLKRKIKSLEIYKHSDEIPMETPSLVKTSCILYHFYNAWGKMTKPCCHVFKGLYKAIKISIHLKPFSFSMVLANLFISFLYVHPVFSHLSYFSFSGMFCSFFFWLNPILKNQLFKKAFSPYSRFLQLCFLFSFYW